MKPGKMGEYLNDFDKGQIVKAQHNWVSASHRPDSGLTDAHKEQKSAHLF